MPQTKILTKELLDLGCSYTANKASFVVWAPNQTRLAVEILKPISTDEYSRKLFSLERSGEYFVGEVKGVEPFQGLGQGCLYRFTNGQEFIPDIYSYYQPFGVKGPSAIVDQAYQWKNQSLKDSPNSITKLHIGTASRPGSFAGLEYEIKTNGYFNCVDAVEFLPIGAFPGRNGWQITENKDTLIITKLSKGKPINWGYDGGASFLLSVSESYGQPAELKSLIDTMHGKKIKVGLDIQVNHYGPEGLFQDWYGPYFSADYTEWGKRPDLKNTQVRRILTAQLVKLVELYRIDFIRLDMSSRYDNDDFIREITEAVKVPVIIEDERDVPVKELGVLARWNFPAVHCLQNLRHNRKDSLRTALELLSNVKDSIVFADSHDEQGNGPAKPLHERLTPALAVMTPAIEMSWYSFGYFHFFCNYQDDIQLVRVTAEKALCLEHYPDHFWGRLEPLNKHFNTFKDCRDFFRFLHSLWLDEVSIYTDKQLDKIRQTVAVWIKNNSRLVEICQDYNEAIFYQANIANRTVPYEYLQWTTALKKLRKDNPWLAKGELSWKMEGPVAEIRRVGPSKTIILSIRQGDNQNINWREE